MLSLSKGDFVVSMSWCVVVMPVAGDVDAAGEPDLVAGLNIIGVSRQLSAS